jgi:class 3 adenylate cyclase/DNA-binding transcriptional MerR regulator
MFGRKSLAEFADYTHFDPDEIERYRAGGLLDPDGDGRFDGRDLLRLQFIKGHAQQGLSFEEIADAVRSAPNSLERRLFRNPSASNVEKAAQVMGMTKDQLSSLRTALGFSPEDTLDEEDIEGLAAGAGLISAGLPWEGILEGARVYADSLRRLALANANMTHRYFCIPFREQGLSEEEINERLGEAINMLAPASERLVNHLLLDYMREALIDHSISHLVPQSDLPPGAERATIVFADLALFSTLADLEGDEAAFELIDRTDSAIRGLLVRHEGRLVKQIGDEFMLMFVDEVNAVRFASDLQSHLGRQERQAAARIGMHSGTVLFRLGDYYGRAVNVASRIASMAMPNSILITEPIAKAAADEGIKVEEIGVRSLRGMDDPVGLYRVLTD